MSSGRVSWKYSVPISGLGTWVTIGEHRCAVAVAVIQAVEEMQAAGAGRAEDRGRTTRDHRLGARGEGPGLLVADME